MDTDSSASELKALHPGTWAEAGTVILSTASAAWEPFARHARADIAKFAQNLYAHSPTMVIEGSAPVADTCHIGGHKRPLEGSTCRSHDEASSLKHR